MSEALIPILPFRFEVQFERVPPDQQGAATPPSICSGSFSECTGLEATMEPKVIKGGGANYGAAQRAGPVTFSTVILKRGMTTTRHLWQWFAHVNQQGQSAFRLNVTIRVAGPGEDLPGSTLTIRLLRALPVKFKCADLNARASEVAIEELHLAHEGLTIE